MKLKIIIFLLGVAGLSIFFVLETRQELPKEDCLECQRIGHSSDGRRWILEKNFGKGIGKRDLVYEVDEFRNKIGEGIRYKSSMRRGEFENGMVLYMPDDSRIQIRDSLIIDFTNHPDEAKWDVLQEERKIAEKSLDEVIKNLKERTSK